LELKVRRYYPKLSKMFGGKMTAYLALVRPFTLAPPIFIGFILTVARMGLSLDAVARGIYIGLTLAFAQACGQVVNQVVDRELDKVVKPYRPIPQGWVTVEEAVGLAWLLTILAIARAFTISTYFGLMTCLMIFFAVFYSLPPLSPRKLNPWINNLWVSFSRSVIPFIAVVGFEGWRYATVAFAWAFGWQPTKDVPDVDGDRRYGIKTIANTYGVGAVKLLATVGTIVYGILSTAWGLWVFLINIPLAVYGLLNFDRRWRGENTVAWMVFYAGLGATALYTAVEEFIIHDVYKP
jgi:4-hydroxybenzoate polyprenyltransferase